MGLLREDLSYSKGIASSGSVALTMKKLTSPALLLIRADKVLRHNISHLVHQSEFIFLGTATFSCNRFA